MSALRLCAVLTFALTFGAVANGAPAVSPDRLDEASSGGFAEVGEFAWRAFIALNWPAGTARGEPDRARALADPGPRVWETFKSKTETFPFAGGERVAATPWESYAGPNPCGVDNGINTIAAFKPFSEFNQPSYSADAPANALVAQNGEYMRYEVRFNAVEFTTILANGWSEGKNPPDIAHPARLPVGSLAVKAAWKPLNASDTPAVRARYYVARAVVVDVARSLDEGRIVCTPRDVALVGLHIVIKTKARAQWIWASFEHIDNVPPAGAGSAREPDAADARAPYGFFDPSRPARLWPPFGAADTLPVDDQDNPPKRAPAAMQIMRRHPINAALMAANRAYWAQPQFQQTVWRNYMLVAAQWPTSNEPPSPDNDGAYFPGQPERAQAESYKATVPAQENLVNTTMESYLQEAPASCMGCHQVASNQNGFDFVGTLANLPGGLPGGR